MWSGWRTICGPIVNNVGGYFFLHKTADLVAKPGASVAQISARVSVVGAIVKQMLYSALLPAFLRGVFPQQPMRDDSAQLARWLGKGKLKIIFNITFRFEDAAKAFEKLNTHHCWDPST